MLATKLFFPMSDEDSGLSRAQVLKQIDASLERLRTDYVDLYQCHRYDEDTPLEETMEALTEVVRAGKARYLGFSEWTAEQVQAALDLPGVEKFVSSQPQYSMLRREPEADVIPLCAQRNLADRLVAARAGRPHGQVPARRAAAARLARHAETMGWADGALPHATTCSRRCSACGRSPTDSGSRSRSSRWRGSLREPNVASAIVGATRPEQVDDNAAASGIELDGAPLRAILQRSASSRKRSQPYHQPLAPGTPRAA